MRILYVDIDSLRPDHLGCYGYHRNTSPTLDQIAAESVRFTNYYASDAPCLPSRTALCSGRFGLHNGVVGHGGTAARMRYPGDGHRTRPDMRPLPMVLSQSGIRTATFTTFAQRHLAWHFYAGWDEIHKFNNQNGNEIAPEVNEALIPWLQAHGQEEDWFLHVNYWDPHCPYRTPAEYGNPFESEPPADWLTPDILEQQWDSYGPRCARETRWMATDNPWERMVLQIRNRDDFKHWIDGYDVGIRYFDHHFAQVLETLDRLGVLEDTALIISADHGENQGELNIYGDHSTADQITNRVPLLIRWPGVTQPGVCDRLLYHLDLAPTLCELAGIESPAKWDGQSFAAALRGEEFSGRDHLVIGQGAWTCQRSVRQGPWLCIRTYHAGYQRFTPTMLFNVEEDPHETTDLSEARPDIVHQCDHLLAEWWRECLSGDDAAPDPMITVIEEGGPFYTRGQLRAYLKWLRDSDRAWAAEELEQTYGADA